MLQKFFVIAFNAKIFGNLLSDLPPCAAILSSYVITELVPLIIVNSLLRITFMDLLYYSY